MSITAKRLEILRYIEAYAKAHTFPPSVREIAAALGISSPASVHHHLVELERDDFLYREIGKARAIIITKKGKQLLGEVDAQHR